jgi:hypothetical protein
MAREALAGNVMWEEISGQLQPVYLAPEAPVSTDFSSAMTIPPGEHTTSATSLLYSPDQLYSPDVSSELHQCSDASLQQQFCSPVGSNYSLVSPGQSSEQLWQVQMREAGQGGLILGPTPATGVAGFGQGYGMPPLGMGSGLVQNVSQVVVRTGTFLGASPSAQQSLTGLPTSFLGYQPHGCPFGHPY